MTRAETAIAMKDSTGRASVPTAGTLSGSCARMKTRSSSLLAGNGDLRLEPSVLVGNALHFVILSSASTRILQVDLATGDMSVIDLPATFDKQPHILLMTTEDNGLGFATIHQSKVYLWSKVDGIDGDAIWDLSRVIELETLLPTDALSISPHVVGFADGIGDIFLGTEVGYFTINLKTNRVKKVVKDVGFFGIFPFISFYTPADVNFLTYWEQPPQPLVVRSSGMRKTTSWMSSSISNGNGGGAMVGVFAHTMPPPLPVLPDELVEEVLLRIPPNDPATLVRAAAVCKRWRRLVSDAGFHRRFAELHRTPPLLGLFCQTYSGSTFVPTTPSCPPLADRTNLFVVDARHGRVLLHSNKRYNWNANPLESAFVVWDPVTDEQKELPLLSGSLTAWSAAVLCSGSLDGSCLHHLHCHDAKSLIVVASPDGVAVIFMRTSREVFAFDLKSTTITRIYSGNQDRVIFPYMSFYTAALGRASIGEKQRAGES
ncbi:hypothetical protein PR202_ga28554 [Eleusine coracana subsp. coracana]|uniref:F-box domain-containing protein n=1 Tax=Eleusine coracana subsp. coracana TaxID=191504 RepID=A0AAV5DJF8_ELECO|nr:hypothetical protein PR202_ga28554 [Eleusine coracana subsp. coracana]